MINCEIELEFSWSKKCIVYEMSIIPAVSGNSNASPPVSDLIAIQITSAIFQIDNT